jgi:hypothetical protein
MAPEIAPNRAPTHLWIVGVLSLLWNAIGAFDYTATKFRLDFYMSQFTPEQLDYFYGFPAWATAGWALGVWGAFAGSVGLLLRKAWSYWAFAVSLLGLAISSLYNLVLSGGMEIMGAGGVAFTAVIWIIAILLFLYARQQTRRGVLA